MWVLPQAVAAPQVWWRVQAVGLLDEVRQEPIAGYAHLTFCQAFWDQMQVLQLSPHFGNDLT